MRLAGQAKLGFYPAPFDAIDALLKHLVIENKSVHILDPCAGSGEGRVGYEGSSIQQIGEGLGIPQSQIYAIELDPGRGGKLREDMPDANVLFPCSFFSTSVTAQSFGLVYCNPPFDDELGGGGREELAFVRASYRLLCTGGVFVLVAPYRTMRHSDTIAVLDTHFRDSYVYRFPKLAFNECVFVGVKRSMPIVTERVSKEGVLTANMKFGYYYSSFQKAEDCDVLGRPARMWDDGQNWACQARTEKWCIPKTWKPPRFLKAGYTDPELLVAISDSPLNRLSIGTVEPPIKEPPLPLERGHVAMLLASGALDGLVETPQGNHVVRGVSSKIEVLNEEASETKMSDDGKSMTIKTVYSEQICLKVRAVDSVGTIYTFTTNGAEVMEEPAKQEDYSYEDWDMIQRLKRVTIANGSGSAEVAKAKLRIEKILKEKKSVPYAHTGT